ncbi:MAG: AAA family ATPase [Erythrobacter sp.]|nr:AAA family ATPase [Erythrobacter sp.]
MTIYSALRPRRRRSSSYGSAAASSTSPAEHRVFLHAWCSAIDRMTSRQLRGRGKDMLECWHDHIDDPDHVMEDPEDFDKLTTQNYVPLLRSLADKHALPKKPGPAPLDRRISWLAATLGLDDVEQAIVTSAARYALFECWENFIDALPGRNSNCSVGRIAFASGLSPARVEARLATGSRLWSTGLIDQSHDGSISANGLLSFIAGVRSGPASLPGLLMPSAPQSTLAWSDFDHLGPQRELAERLVASNEGVAILLYGPPGTGKSEFARLLASRLGRKAIFAGLSDDCGSEPSRRERIAHLSVLRALTRNDDSRIVVMDEADDILVLEEPGDREHRSKLWLNRLIEDGKRPTIWIVNEPRMLEESIVRRMSLALEFPRPPLHVRRNIVGKHAKAVGIAMSEQEVARLAALPAAPAILASAIRGASKARGDAGDAQAIGEGLVTVIQGRPPEPFSLPVAYDPNLSLADRDLDGLATRLAASAARNWSVLLSGPSGTGKSAYARHLAERLGIEIIEKRGSDLLGMYVGQTEMQIAQAFAEASRAGALLLIDEADDFLFDRREAQRGWERSMVNEMLRQMEALKAPFVATTNLADRLDPATRRRFTMHAEFRALDPKRAAMLFLRWFDVPLPRGITLHGQTPGDFAVIDKRRKLLDESDPMVIVGWLRGEAEARGEGRKAMGFAA